jgi:hypothetical protein
MSSEENERLEAELGRRKQALREDLSEVKHKVLQTQEQLSPAKFVREHQLMLCGAAFIVGALLGYRDVPISDLAKPAIRSTLTTAGKQAALRAIRG